MAKLKGKCLCGAVTVTATPTAEGVDACHCSLCRRWSGGPFMAMECANEVEITSDDALGVYQSSQWAERTFCKNCGTVIGWRLQEGGSNHVSANLFVESENYPLTSQVFIDEKPGNYSFEQKTKTMTGAELFAMFAPSEGK